jgi:ABC-type glycerol-3-phosphate transport system substrate-binding protein
VTTPRRTRLRGAVAGLAAGIALAAALMVAGCTTSAESEPEDSLDTGATTDVTASGSSPVVFAFVCATGTGDETETYTTYSAAWEDDRTRCSATRITGTEMSSQQRSAVDAADGDATLEELAATCAVRGTGPWADAVTSEAQEHVAAGLLRYCPGHPDVERLRDAVDAWRG